MTTPTESTTPPRRRRTGVIIGVTALLLGLGAGALGLGIAMSTPPDDAITAPSADPSDAPSNEPTARPTPSDTGSAEPTSAPEPERAALPADCASLYSGSMTAELQSYGVALNPAWTIDNPEAGLGFADPQLEAWTAEWQTLRCLWTTPDGGSGIGLETHVVPVLPDEGVAVEAQLASLGYSSVDELGGTRYLWSVTDDEFGGAWGESHIVVGGYWFATAWIDLGVTGYTADMVQNLVGTD
ncbi:MAG TPA: hypothetical protein VFM95_02850 [Microcella sp.]|nr:hypothetical protein [Microcella sp.]